MKRSKYILLLILVLIAIGIGIKCLINKNNNSFRRDTQDSSKTNSQYIDSLDNVRKPTNNIYSLALDRKYENELIEQTKRKILDHTTPQELLIKLKNGNEGLKLDAIEQLGYVADINGQREIEKLLLADSSDDVRIACAKALNIIRTPNSKESLIKALNDKNVRVGIWAGQALALIGEKEESLKFFTGFYEKGNDIPYYSCHIGFLEIGKSEVRPYLLKDTSNSDSNIAMDAAIILAQIGYGSDVFSFFEKNLSSPDKYIKMAALRGLAYIGDSASLQLIHSKVNDPDVFVKDRANTIIDKFK